MILFMFIFGWHFKHKYYSNVSLEALVSFHPWIFTLVIKSYICLNVVILGNFVLLMICICIWQKVVVCSIFSDLYLVSIKILIQFILLFGFQKEKKYYFWSVFRKSILFVFVLGPNNKLKGTHICICWISDFRCRVCEGGKKDGKCKLLFLNLQLSHFSIFAILKKNNKSASPPVLALLAQ